MTRFRIGYRGKLGFWASPKLYHYLHNDGITRLSTINENGDVTGYFQTFNDCIHACLRQDKDAYFIFTHINVSNCYLDIED